MMDLAQMRHLLTEWGHWANREGAQSRGRTVGSYAERIGGDSYGDTFVPAVDVDILRLDDLIRRLPLLLIQTLDIAYKDPRPLKSKLPPTVPRTAHNERVRTAQIILIDMWVSDKSSGKTMIAADSGMR